MGKTSVVQYPFAGGIDQKTASQYLDPNARLYSVVNGNYTKIGKVDKRAGIGWLNNAVLPPASGTIVQAGEHITSWNRSDVTVIGASELYFYSPDYNGVTQVSPLPPVYPVRRPVNTFQQGATPQIVDFTYNGANFRIALSLQTVQGTGILLWATVYNSDTGDVVLEPTVAQTLTDYFSYIVNAFALPNALNTNAVSIFTTDQTHLYQVNYDPVANTFSSPGLLQVSTNGGWDVVPYVGDPQNGFIVQCYHTTTQLYFLYYLPNGSYISGQTLTATAGQTFVSGSYAVAQFGNTNWAVYTTVDGGGAYRYFMLQMSGDYVFTIQLGGPQQATIPDLSGLTGAVALSATYLMITFTNGANLDFSADNGIDTTQPGWSVWNNVGAQTYHTPNGPIGYYAMARPFLVNGTVYQVYAYLNFLQTSSGSNTVASQQVTCYLMKFMAPNSTTQLLPVATVAKNILNMDYTLLYRTLYWNDHYCLMNQDSTGLRWSIGLTTNGIAQSVVSGYDGQSWTQDFFFDEPHLQKMYASSELGSELHIAASTPFVTDAKTAFEDNFFNYPEFSYSTFYNASSDDLTAGLYLYAVCYSYQDAAGLIHRSAPYFLKPITFPNPSHPTYGIQLQLLSYQATWKDIDTPNQVFCEVYRTISNGSVFYFIDRIQCSNTDQPYIAWPTSTTCDNTSDQDAQTASLLYTTGGVLPNINPSAFVMQITHCGRIAGVDETLSQVWFSQVFTPGQAPGFSGSLVVPFPEKGDITAIASMDDKFLVFKESSIWVMQGLNGPAQTGQGSDWSVPIQIPTNVGCISSTAIETTDIGVFFQSNQGIYLLGRDLSVVFIGAQVQDLTTQYPTIVDIVKIPEANQIRFICTDGTDSASIVYDYYLKQWALHTYPNMVTGYVVSACLSYQSPNLLTMLTSDGNIWQEHAPGSEYYWLDEQFNGVWYTFIPTSVSTAWIKTSLQGYMRSRQIQLMAETASGVNLPGLQISIAINYDETTQVQSNTWTSTKLSTLRVPGQVQVYVGAKWNQAQAYMITVNDVIPDAYFANGYPVPQSTWTGQGASFVGIAMELDMLGPRYLLLPSGARQ